MTCRFGPSAEASFASPAELTTGTTGIPDDMACTDAFKLSDERSDMECY